MARGDAAGSVSGGHPVSGDRPTAGALALAPVRIERLDVPGAVLFSPTQHADDRGVFLEWLRAEDLRAALGHELTLAQANLSVSARGVLRGVHLADVPPGQAKYVTCVRGAVLDVIVDLRVGSPAFGTNAAVRLDETDRRAVYLPEGVGHAFLSLVDGSTVTYLTSTGYDPGAEFAVHPLDPDLALPWPTDPAPLLSPRDAAAPSLALLREQGRLPSWTACQSRYQDLRGGQ